MTQKRRFRRPAPALSICFLLAFLLAAGLACAPLRAGESCPPLPPDRAGQLQLAVELEAAAPRPGETLHLRVEVGPLPPRASLWVCDRENRLVGVVAPYGSQARGSGGSYLLPVPAAARGDGKKLELRLRLAQEGAEVRPPTPDELKKIELVAIPRS